MSTYRRNRRLPPAPSRQRPAPRAFTLVEMLIAMAITLVMMAAVVTLFANVSNSVRNRRATIEMSSQVRHLRNVLQQDLQGATCPGLTWQRPESNHGYIELIEGLASDSFPTQSRLVDAVDSDGIVDTIDDGDGTADIDPTLSTIPRNNIGLDANNDGRISTQEREEHHKNVNSLVPGGLGDYDDTLMFTSRNEHEPFVGRVPTNVRGETTAFEFDVDDTTNPNPWGYESIESPLAEVVWFAIENPPSNQNATKFFGEAGMRTIYRRALLIAPWLNPYRYTDPDNGNIVDEFKHDGDDFKAEPGLVRMLPGGIGVEDAIAAIIAFQDRYDLSVRLEWDHNIERWKIMANTLADLTKRENRYGHFGFVRGTGGGSRTYPYPALSFGNGYNDAPLEFVVDPELTPDPTEAEGTAHVGPTGPTEEMILRYTVDEPGSGYLSRPLVYVRDNSALPATAQAMLDDQGAVVRVIHGPVPLWGSRRGQDLIMSNVLGFDLRVYDPGAPLFGARDDLNNAASNIGVVLQPSDPGWADAYRHSSHTGANGIGGVANSVFPFMGQGAYVDMGYGYLRRPTEEGMLHDWKFASASATFPWFFEPRGLMDVFGSLLAPGYTVYDTWSFHYENNGRDDDNRDGDNNLLTGADEGTNGVDGGGYYLNSQPIPKIISDIRLGPDDAGERETVPPYDKPLRGVQVLIRTYEPDSRAIRQVRVNQHFLPE